MATDMQTQHTQDLFNKICRLPPEKVSEVEDFVDFLRYRSKDNTLIKAASKLSEKSFQQVWDNIEDAEYDNL
jgi:hypothetical protein